MENNTPAAAATTAPVLSEVSPLGQTKTPLATASAPLATTSTTATTGTRFPSLPSGDHVASWCTTLQRIAG